MDWTDIPVARRPHDFNGLSPGSLDIQEHKHSCSWSILVRIYAGRKLSLLTDRIPVLGALAEEYKVLYAVTDYYAGLWKEDFLWQLLWTTNQTLKRQEQYCGPTWSWCSLPLEKLYFPGPQPNRYRMRCTVVNVQVELLSKSNLFGEVKAASLTLRGRTRPIVWVTKPEQRSEPSELGLWGLREPAVPPELREPSSEVTGRFIEGRGGGCHIERELLGPPSSRTELLAIEIGNTGVGDEIDWETRDSHAYNDSYTIEPEGLVLQRIGSNNGQYLYQRVGSLTLRSSQLFQSSNVVERELIIV